VGSFALPLLLATAPVQSGNAAVPRAGIQWDAPPECGSVAELEEQVEALASTGEDDIWRGAHASARVDRSSSGFRAVVELHTSEGDSHHEFEANTCAEIAEVVALETAMMLDAVRTVEQVEVAPEPAGDKPHVQPSEPSKPARVTGRVFVLGGAALGQPDRVAGAFRVGAGLDVSWLRVALSAHATTPEKVTHSAFPEEGANILVLGGAVDACFVPGKARLWVPLCLGFEGGAFRGRGFGVDNPTASYRPYVAPRIGTGLEIDLTRHIALALALETPLVALRPVFSIGGLGELYQAPIASFRLLAGLHVRWGR